DSRGCRLFNSARSGQTYSTEVPRQSSSLIRVRRGKVAASVFPPAVGASRIASSPATRGATDASCNGRSPGQPRVLTMWCCTEGVSASSPVSGSVIAEVEVDVVRVDAGPGGGPLGGAHGDLVVAARVEVLELVHPVQHVDELAQEDPGREPHLGAE